MFRPYFNKSLMAGADIPAGTVLTREIIFAMRPRMYAGGLPSERFEEVLTQVLEKVARCCKEHGFCLSEPLRDETKKTIAQKWETKPML